MPRANSFAAPYYLSRHLFTNFCTNYQCHEQCPLHNRAQLAHSMVLEKVNAEMVSRAVNDVLSKILEVDAENVKLLLTDAAPYTRMIKCGGQLKVFYP